MIKKLLLLLVVALVVVNYSEAQTIEELKAQKADKEAQLGTIQGEVDALDKLIYEFPGWKFGGVGVLGLDLASNNNWYAIGNPNSSSTGLGLGITGFANLDEDKYFWRNGLNINLNRNVAFTDKSVDATKVVALSDLLDFSSLFGYKLTPKIALSAELKWLSSLLKLDTNGTLDNILDDKYSFSLNNPGSMTVSAGVTWLPIPDLVVLLHPLGYQKNWPGEFISSAGCKIGATYTRELMKGIKWNSNLSAFIPYTGDKTVTHSITSTNPESTFPVAYSGGDLMNWVWINGFSFTVWKGIGVGLNVGLRGDKQIANNQRLNSATSLDATTGELISDPSAATTSDNPLQSYYTIGLSYGF